MATTKRTWLWVILGIAGTLALLVIMFIGGAIYTFRTHVKNEYVESTVAEREFTQARARFAGQQPLIELIGDGDRNDDSTIHRPPADAPRVEINHLRVLIYDLHQGHLIHADVPGWLLRMMRSNGGFGNGFDSNFGNEFERHRLTIEDLERHGLGLVLDGHNPNTRIMMWTE